jgi:hypothetical protein
MSNIQTAVTSVIPQAEAASLFTTLVLNSDLSKLSEPQRVEYYKIVCERAGLDPMAKPFDLLLLNGKMVLYANKTTTAQLTANHRLNVSIVSKEVIGNVLLVTARATKPNGASTEDIGAVSIGNLQGDAAANAHMKAITKAKRRAVLSVCGLGMLDETETDTIPAGTVEHVPLPLALAQEIKTSKLSDEESATAEMWKDTIEGAENGADLTRIALQIKNASQALREVVGPIVKQRADSLNLVWSGGKYAERN